MVAPIDVMELQAETVIGLPAKASQHVVALICSCGCGTGFQRPKRLLNKSGLHYVSVEHAGAHRTRLYLEETCGSFLGLVTEYLDELTTRGYKSVGTIRGALCPFALFLNEQGIADLGNVTPKTITNFLAWADAVDHKSAAHDISSLSGFFHWANRNGYRKSTTCPVVPKFHSKKRPHYLPRPYTPEEMSFIWSLADERGNSRIRAVVAIGEESGLRLGEICQLRVQDVDIESRRFFVRLPNKTGCERWAMFSDKTARFVAEWLSDRDPHCEHDQLFHNSVGNPLLPATLHRELCRVLCKTYAAEQINVEGVEQWSTHRLRHTMASNLASGGASIPVIMASGGWRSVSSMMIYTQNDIAVARRGYDEAMRRHDEQSTTSTSKEILSLDVFLAEYGVEG